MVTFCRTFPWWWARQPEGIRQASPLRALEGAEAGHAAGLDAAIQADRRLRACEERGREPRGPGRHPWGLGRAVGRCLPRDSGWGGGAAAAGRRE